MGNYITIHAVDVDGYVTKSDNHKTLETAEARLVEVIELGFTDAFIAPHPMTDARWLTADMVAQTTAYDAPSKDAETRAWYWTRLRKERDRLLNASDNRFSSDAPVGRGSQAWKDYRQALRDLPVNTTDPANPVWSVEPE